MLNVKGASIVSLAALELRFILVNIFCHRNCSSSPVASTVKAMDVPVTTDWLSGCRVILGGSTVRKDLTVRIVMLA